jgi:hypothetical protein
LLAYLILSVHATKYCRTCATSAKLILLRKVKRDTVNLIDYDKS